MDENQNTENQELEVNKQKREEYENLMEKSSINKDGYWDKNNPAVKLILGVLGLIIIFGVLYFLFTALSK